MVGGYRQGGLGRSRYGGFHHEPRRSFFGRLLRLILLAAVLAVIAGAVATPFVEIPPPTRLIEAPATLTPAADR